MSHSVRERIVACPRHATARDGLDAGSCRFRQIATSEFASFPLVNRGRAAGLMKVSRRLVEFLEHTFCTV